MLKEAPGKIHFRKTFYSLIIVAIILFVISFSLSVNVPPQETATYSLSGTTITVSPSTIYITHFLWYTPSILVQVTLNHSSNSIPVTVVEQDPSTTLVYQNVFHNVSFFYFYMQTHYAGKTQLERYSLNVNGQVFNISIQVKNSILPLLGETSLIMSFVFFLVGLYLAPFKSKFWFIPVTLGYIFLLPFFGQRYDMFFMISSGFHILSGVNPFTGSAVLYGALKWAYPPYYLFWSTLSDWLAVLFTRTPLPSSVSLIYPGVLLGNLFDAWKAFVPRSLPVFYLLSKVPMLASTILIYYVLEKKFRLNYNLNKLWLLSPFVIIVGIVWGQLDIIVSLSLLLSIYFLLAKRTDLSVLAATLGFWVEIFPAFILPFVLIASKHKLRDSGIIAAASVPALLFYYFTGNFLRDITTGIYSRSVPTFNGSFYAQGLTWQTVLYKLGVHQFPPLFLYSFIPFLVILCVIYYYKKGNIVNYVIAEFLFYFLTYNFVNPQYFVILIPLFLLNGDMRNYLAFSIYPLVYIVLNYAFPYWIVPSLSLNYFSSVIGQLEEARVWATGSLIFLVPLIAIFTSSILVTSVELIRGERIVLKKKFPSSP
ncbi:MAG: hypothetical protein QXU18_00995 [Thermoplasmatales archaeon]